MFVGHTALALAAKAKLPRTSLGWLVAAVFALDLLWPPFLLLGIERVRIEPGAMAFNPLVFESYPWSHSLLMAVVWGGLLGMIAAKRRAEVGPPLLLVGLVVSHWFLDVVVHRPDLPLWPGRSPLVGLGLWNSIPATFLVEGTLLLAGVAIYIHTAVPRDRIGLVGLWSFLALQVILWMSGPWGAPPPSPRMLAWFTMGLWLFVFWAGWIDRRSRKT